MTTNGLEYSAIATQKQPSRRRKQIPPPPTIRLHERLRRPQNLRQHPIPTTLPPPLVDSLPPWRFLSADGLHRRLPGPVSYSRYEAPTQTRKELGQAQQLNRRPAVFLSPGGP